MFLADVFNCISIINICILFLVFSDDDDDDVNWWSTFWLVPCALVQMMWNNGVGAKRCDVSVWCVCEIWGAKWKICSNFLSFARLSSFNCPNPLCSFVNSSIPQFQPMNCILSTVRLTRYQTNLVWFFFLLVILLYILFSCLLIFYSFFVYFFSCFSHSVATSIAMTCSFSSKAQQ